MNRIHVKIVLSFIAFMLIGFLTIGTHASENQIPQGLLYEITDEGVVITGYTGSESALILPKMIEGKPVIRIGWAAFENNTTIEGIIIQNGLLTIEAYAFYGCTKLRAIQLPSSLQNIGGHSFEQCASLEKVTLPTSLSSLGPGVFSQCENLTTINLENILIFESGAAGTFSGCSRLRDVKLAEGVKTIASSMFSGCNSLSSITLPKNLTKIENNAFSGCSNLSEISIPASVTSIEGGAFSNCTQLSKLDLPINLRSIEPYTFNGCTELRSIQLPNHVNAIGESAFSHCDNLTSVYIPTSVAEIGSYAFAHSYRLNTVTIPFSVKKIGEYLFGYDNSGKTIRGYSSSEAEKYAYDNNINFEMLPLIKMTDIQLSEEGFSMKVGEKQQLTARIFPENTTYQEISWSSTNLNVAMVTSNGTVMAVSEGQVIIHAIAKDGSNVIASCAVVVQPDNIGFDLNPGASLLQVGDHQQLISKAKEAAVILPSLTWLSSDDSVATVDQNGLVTAIAPGTVIITATANDGSGMMASCGIQVQLSITDIIIEPAEIYLEPKSSVNLNLRIKPENATIETLVWISSDETVAVVNSNGVVRSFEEGEAEITVLAQDGSGVSSSSKITVLLLGDANNNGQLEIDDLLSIIDYLVNGVECTNMIKADANRDTQVNLSDLILIVNKLNE